MESAGRRQGERAGSVESTRRAQARPRGRRCRQAAQRAHEPGPVAPGLFDVEVELMDGWVRFDDDDDVCFRNVFAVSKRRYKSRRAEEVALWVSVTVQNEMRLQRGE